MKRMASKTVFKTELSVVVLKRGARWSLQSLESKDPTSLTVLVTEPAASGAFTIILWNNKRFHLHQTITEESYATLAKSRASRAFFSDFRQKLIECLCSAEKGVNGSTAVLSFLKKPESARSFEVVKADGPRLSKESCVELVLTSSPDDIKALAKNSASSRLIALRAAEGTRCKDVQVLEDRCKAIELKLKTMERELAAANDARRVANHERDEANKAHKAVNRLRTKERNDASRELEAANGALRKAYRERDVAIQGRKAMERELDLEIEAYRAMKRKRDDALDERDDALEASREARRERDEAFDKRDEAIELLRRSSALMNNRGERWRSRKRSRSVHR